MACQSLLGDASLPYFIHAPGFALPMAYRLVAKHHGGSVAWIANPVRVGFPFLASPYHDCMADMRVTLGRLQLRNPILVASGTFGYAREMAGAVDFSQLGG